MAYDVEYTTGARLDLRFHVCEASWIVDQIEAQLRHVPTTTQARNRKPSRPGAPAAWELRAVPFRVFYDVDEDQQTVYVVAVFKKERAVWRRRGQKETLDG